MKLISNIKIQKKKCTSWGLKYPIGTHGIYIYIRNVYMTLHTTGNEEELIKSS